MNCGSRWSASISTAIGTATSVEMSRKRKIAGLLTHVPRVVAVGLLLLVIAEPWRGITAPAVPAPPPLQSLHMVSPTKGWALTTRHCVLHTEDGGVHWRNVTPTRMTAGIYRGKTAAFSLTSAAAWVVASSPIPRGPSMTGTAEVFRTVDGGRTWRSATLETGDVFQITFVNARAGWLIAFLNGGMMSDLVEIFRTVDGGATWVKVASAGDETMPAGTPPSGLPRSGKKYGIGFVNPTTGWVVGYAPRSDYVYLFVTHDGGRTWREQDLPRPPGPRSDDIATLRPTFFSPQHGALPIEVSRRNDRGIVVYTTRDGGASWRPTTMVPGTTYGLDETYDLADADHWWIIGDAGLVATADGGRHWDVRTRPGPGVRLGVTFASPTAGWAFSWDRAVLLRTVDGGRRWAPLSSTVAPACPP